MTQLTDEHFELHTKNKAEQYERQKIKFLEDRIATLEKTVANLTKRYAEVRTWLEENFRGKKMSNFVWCHGPSCHTSHTQDRIRGVKGSKVLRTRKVKQDQWNSGERYNMYSNFCSQGCYNDFANKYVREVIAIAPRTEPLETPIDVVKETATDWHNQPYVRTKIIAVDNNGG